MPLSFPACRPRLDPDGLEGAEAEMRARSVPLQNAELAPYEGNGLTFLNGVLLSREYAFFISAESGVDAVSERRQTEPAAIGLALDYIY
jgi:hypothetical protein